MANTFKKIIKKHKKKKLQAERNRKAKARERAEEEYADDYERRLSRHKRSVVKKTVITVVAIAAAVTAVGFYIEKRIIKASVKKKILKRKTILQRKKYQQSRQIQNKNRTKQNSFRM